MGVDHVTGDKGAEVHVWAVASGRCLGMGVGHVGAVSAVALGSKGSPPKFIMSAGADKLKVRLGDFSLWVWATFA